MENLKNFFQVLKHEIRNNLPQILSLRDKRKVKKDNTFVTEGDFLIQALASDLIKNYLDEPAIISEEDPTSLKIINDNHCLVTLDPIDGTENFTSGLPEWGIGISVFHNLKHAASIILLPELDRSLESGQKINYFHSRINGLSSSIISDTSLSLKANTEYRITGCSMYNIYNTINGSFKSYKNIQGVNSWDLLPGANLALEHNLTVKIDGKKYNGEFLYPNKKYCIEIYR